MGHVTDKGKEHEDRAENGRCSKGHRIIVRDAPQDVWQPRLCVEEKTDRNILRRRFLARV